MANDNVTLQTIQIDTAQASDNLKKLNNDLKTLLGDNNKTLADSSKSFKQNETQVKQWGESATDTIKKYGQAALANIKLGAQALTLDLGRTAIQSSAKEAVNMAFSFSKAFAEIKSRSNASAQDLQRWRSTLMQISVETTANMDSMAESFKDLFSSVKNPDELLKIMNSIGNAAAMGDGDATKVSGVVKKTLQEQGREINAGNVNDVLASSDVLRRTGNGYKDETAALGAMGGIRGQDISNSGMSMRQIANMMSAATQASGNVVGGDAIKTLLAGNSDLETRVKLQAGLGLKSNANGQLDLSSLGGSQYSKTVMGMGSTDEMRRMSLKGITGASDDVVQAFLNIAKDGSKFQEALKTAQIDTKTFGESAAQSKDNLENAYKGFDQSLIKGVSDIFGGFEGPLKDLLHGNVGSAVGGAGGAIGQSLEGIGKHPALVAGALATTFAGGALLKGIFGRIPGMGLAKGMAEGQIAKKMGAEPVFVVNASEIGDSGAGATGTAVGAAMSPFGAVLKGLGMAFLGTVGAVGAGAALGYAGGKMVNGYLDENTTEENKYGQKSNAAERKIAQWLSTPEQYNEVYGDGGGGHSGGNVQRNPNKHQDPHKVVFEVHAVDTTLKVVPKAGHLQKDSRTQ